MRIAPIAGTVLTAKCWNARYVATLHRTVSQSVTSSTTKINDDVFTAALEASATYQVRIAIGVTGAEAGDIAIAWTLPALAVGTRQCLGPNSGTTSPAATMATLPARLWTEATTYGTDPVEGLVMETGHVQTVGAGVMQMTWAQGTSSATATVITADSYMTIERIA